MLVFVSVYLIISSLAKDASQGNVMKYYSHPKYDSLQKYCVAAEINEKSQYISSFDTKNEFYSFYMTSLKINHPILGIFYFYSNQYKRIFRVLDILLLIFLKITFAMIPFYYRDNTEMQKVVQRRSIHDKGTTPSTLDVMLDQVSDI